MTNRTYDILLCAPDLAGNERLYLERCIAENWISTAGPFVDQFEQKIAALLGRKYAVATSSGTAAIELALIGAGLRPGDRVIVPDWTFSATATAAAHAGASLYMADITLDGLGLDPEDLERALALHRNESIRVGAVIAVHPFGYPANLNPLRDICAAYGVPLVEDAAGAIGTLYEGSHVGGHGSVSALSFNGNKTLTTGGGGMALTDNAEQAQAIRAYSTNSHGPNYHYKVIGYNHRMTNLAAAIGLAQLERLDEMIESKKRIAARYDRALQEIGGLQTIPTVSWGTPNSWMYCAYAESEYEAKSLIDFMDERRIQVRIFWRSLASEPAFAGAGRSELKNSRFISGRVVALPCSSHLTMQEQERVIDALRSWRKNRLVAA